MAIGGPAEDPPAGSAEGSKAKPALATPATTMVMGSGGYRFRDYWKLGLPLVVFFIAVATFLVPLIWRF